MIQMLREKLDPYYAQAEWWLFNCPRKRTAIEEMHEDLLGVSSSMGGMTSIPPKGTVTDSTGRKAVQLAAANEDYRWVLLMDEIEEGLDAPIKELLHRHRVYGKALGRRNARARVARDMGYSVRRVRDLWRELVYYVAFRAVQEGLARESKSRKGQKERPEQEG